MLRLLSTALTSIVVLFAVQIAAAADANQSGVADALRAAVKSGHVPKDLLVTYDDIDALHGGTRLEVRGDGKGRRSELLHGGSAPRVSMRPVSEAELLDMTRELVELEAWLQKTPDRPPVPDESKSTLTIAVGGKSVAVWEWYNDMAKTNRMQKVLDRMSGLVPADGKPE